MKLKMGWIRRPEARTLDFAISGDTGARLGFRIAKKQNGVVSPRNMEKSDAVVRFLRASRHAVVAEGARVCRMGYLVWLTGKVKWKLWGRSQFKFG
jgi:hypothetical protein